MRYQVERAFFSKVVCCILCYFLSVNAVMADSSHSLKHQEKELEILKMENSGGEASYKQKKLEKSKNEFGFGNQLGDFSLNYLLFISHYIPGSIMPVVCRNPMVTHATLGLGALLPVMWLDNMFFSLGSIVSLYTEIMIFDHLQSFYKKMESRMKDAKSADGEADLQLLGLTLQHEALEHEMDMLSIKAEAIRATKTAWLLSGALSAATGIVMLTASAVAIASCATAAGATAGPAIAAAGGTLGAAIGFCIGVCIAGVGELVTTEVGAAYGMVIGAEVGTMVGATAAVGAGAYAGAVLSDRIHAESGDACMPMFAVTGAALAGVGINEAIKNYGHNAEPHPKLPAGQQPGSVFQDLQNLKNLKMKKQLLPIVERATSFDELLYSLVEMQTGRKLTALQYEMIQQELKNKMISVSSEDFAALKNLVTMATKEDLWKKSNELMEKLSPISQAQATTTDDQDEAQAVSEEAAEAGELGDSFNIFKDASSVFNTNANLASLSSDSEIGADLSKIKLNDMSTGKEFIQKYLTWDFYVKFANYLGFSNGGELAFLLYITMVGDLVVLKSRSQIIHPLVPYFYGIDGTWEAKLVSSLVAAHFANAYRKEVLEAKIKVADFKLRVSKILDAMKNTNKGGMGSTSKTSNKSSKGEAAIPTASVELKECISGGDLLGPQSISPCPAQQTPNNQGLNLDNESFKSLLGNFGQVPTGSVTSLTQALNHLSKGDSKRARGELSNLGASGPSLAASIKKQLELINKKFPKSKINERLANLEKLYGNRIQNAMKSAELKMALPPSHPLSFATLASIAPPTEAKSDGSKTEHPNEVKKSAAVPDFGGFKMDFARGKPLPVGSGQISSYSKQDYQEAMKNDYEYKDDDISENANEDLFKTITLRYFKTVYPKIFKKKE